MNKYFKEGTTVILSRDNQEFLVVLGANIGCSWHEMYETGKPRHWCAEYIDNRIIKSIRNRSDNSLPLVRRCELMDIEDELPYDYDYDTL